MISNERRRELYRDNPSKDIARVQAWRKANPKKYREIELKRNRYRRHPKMTFLQEMGFDVEKDTLKRENWVVYHKNESYKIIECCCGADDCKGFALVLNDEIQINAIENILKLIKTGRFTKANQCLTKKLT